MAACQSRGAPGRRATDDRDASALRVPYNRYWHCWNQFGFSVFAGQPVSPEDSQQVERLACYITRPPLAIDSIRRGHDGRLEIGTPPDPRTGATVRTFDPLDWIHTVTAHIPDRGQHQVRYYGAVSNPSRASRGLSTESCATSKAVPARPAISSSPELRPRRQVPPRPDLNP